MVHGLDRAHSYADFAGHAINRLGAGFREYRQLLQPVHACSIQYPKPKSPAPPALILSPTSSARSWHPRRAAPHALSHHLRNRRGAPENPQGPFDTVAKCALLRAYARAYGLTEDRILISEVNWPLLGTGVWSPVNSPYETRDPRQNDPSVSEADYAAFMARYLLLTLASGHVARVYWWRLVARGFGLIDDTDPAAWRRPRSTCCKPCWPNSTVPPSRAGSMPPPATTPSNSPAPPPPPSPSAGPPPPPLLSNKRRAHSRTANGAGQGQQSPDAADHEAVGLAFATETHPGQHELEQHLRNMPTATTTIWATGAASNATAHNVLSTNGRLAPVHRNLAGSQDRVTTAARWSVISVKPPMDCTAT